MTMVFAVLIVALAVTWVVVRERKAATRASVRVRADRRRRERDR